MDKVTTLENVVAFATYQESMTDPIISDVIRYWDGLRGNRQMPERSEIDPREMSEVLSYTFILDRPRPGVIRFRLSGAHLNELMGMEVRGMPLRSFFELPDRAPLMELAEAAFTTPAMLKVDLVSDAQGRAALPGQLVILPLQDGAGECHRALGAFVTAGVIGLPPRRFRVERHGLTPLRPGRPLFAAPHPGVEHQIGLQEPGTPFQMPDTPPVARQRPRLRVVKGGRA